MGNLQSYIELFGNNHNWLFIVAFILVLFGGEPMVLTLSFLASTKDIFELWELIVIGFSTALLAEIFWFLLARSPWAKLLDKKYIESKVVSDFHNYFGKIERNRPLRLLFLTKFISGMQIFVIIYLSRKGLNFVLFLKYCIIVNLFWTPVVTLVGWSGGKGFTFLYDLFQNLHLVLGIVFLVVVVLYIASRFFRKEIAKNL